MELTCADAVFTAKGKAVREEGWKGIEAMFRPEGKEKEEKEIKNLPKQRHHRTPSGHIGKHLPLLLRLPLQTSLT